MLYVFEYARFDNNPAWANTVIILTIIMTELGERSLGPWVARVWPSSYKIYCLGVEVVKE